MSLFEMYIKLGFEHIADINSYDHILFIVTLCAVYSLKQWKNVLILVTAFTIGHTTTLALATLNIIKFPTELVEFFIPVTIFITAIGNFIQKSLTVSSKLHLFKYSTALFFGLIHGLGFSNYLHSLLGNESSIIMPLFTFNLGVELGQLFIVSCIIASTYLIVDYFKVIRREWNLILSGAGFGVSLLLMVERFPF